MIDRLRTALEPVSPAEGLGADAWEPFGTPPEPPHQSR